MSDINKLWSILKSSSMYDKDMQKAFERAATPNACIELLEDVDTMQARINELQARLMSAKSENVRLKKLCSDIKDWDLSALLIIPLELRNRIRSELSA